MDKQQMDKTEQRPAAPKDAGDLWQRLLDLGSMLACHVEHSCLCTDEAAAEAAELLLADWEKLQDDIENDQDIGIDRLEEFLAYISAGEDKDHQVTVEREFRKLYQDDPNFRAAIDQQREREANGTPTF